MIDLNLNPSKKDLRWFGVMFAVFAGIVGVIAIWQFDAPTAAKWIWIVGVSIGVLYYILPPFQRYFFVGWMLLAFPIGWVISHLILGVVYYLILTPIGLVMKLLGHDPMQRKIDREADTYWQAHKPTTEPGRYFRQF